MKEGCKGGRGMEELEELEKGYTGVEVDESGMEGYRRWSLM